MERKTKQNPQQEALRSWQSESLVGPNEAAKTVAVPGFVSFLWLFIASVENWLQ